MAWVPLLVISNVALFCMNFNFSNRVMWVPPSNIFTIANPDISSMKGALTFYQFFSLGFKIILCSGNMGTDQFKNVKQQSLEIITPSNLNTFFMPRSQHFHVFLTLMYKFQIYAHVHL